MKLRFTLLMAICLFTGVSAYAQEITNDECKALIKERRNAQKMAATALGKQVDKIAKKEAKALEKEGWKNRPGSLPLEIQLKNYYIKKYSGAKKFPEYIEAIGQGKAKNISMANSIATALAMTNTAKQIQSEVTSLVELNLVGVDDETAVKMTEATKLITSQKLNRTQVEVEMYREQNGQVEVVLRTLYDGKKARALVLQEMETISQELREKMERLMNE